MSRLPTQAHFPIGREFPCAGSILLRARPALQNSSIFIYRDPQAAAGTSDVADADALDQGCPRRDLLAQISAALRNEAISSRASILDDGDDWEPSVPEPSLCWECYGSVLFAATDRNMGRLRANDSK
jgi:hypothetical protein